MLINIYSYLRLLVKFRYVCGGGFGCLRMFVAHPITKDCTSQFIVYVHFSQYGGTEEADVNKT